MVDEALKPCPCGQTPTTLQLFGAPPQKYTMAAGDCCNEWIIEFRSQYERDDAKLQDLAAKAWNAMQRGGV